MNIHDTRVSIHEFKAYTCTTPIGRKAHIETFYPYKVGDIVRLFEYDVDNDVLTGWRADFIVAYTDDCNHDTVSTLVPRWPDETGAPRIVDGHVR